MINYNLHYEKMLLENYKNGFSGYINERYNLHKINKEEKKELMQYFDIILNIDNIVHYANNSFKYHYNLFLKHIRLKNKLKK